MDAVSEYQPRLAPARSAPAEQISQPNHPVRQNLPAGLRPSQVPAWPAPAGQQPGLTMPHRGQAAGHCVAAVPPPGGLVQAKLAVGAPQDRWELEADRVADAAVRRLPARPAPRAEEENGSEAGMPTARRFPAERAAGPDGHSVQVQASHPRPGTQGGAATGDTEAAILAAAGGGKPLGGDVRAAMEEGFGADFSGVRVHQDAAAHDLSQKLRAAAFTMGRDVFLPPAAPSLAAPAGQRLLAHELTHVLQQGAAPGQAAHNATAAPLIQCVRDLAEGTPVEFSDEGSAYGGTVTARHEGGGIKYKVEDGSGKTYVCLPNKVEPVEKGKPLEPGTKVKATVFREVLDCTVKEVLPPDQYYDINVEWAEGLSVPKPFPQEVSEQYVRPKQGEFQPGAIKTAQQPTIEHFYPDTQAGPNAGEYVKPGGPIDITSHALGSGVYGIAEPDEQAYSSASKTGPYKTAKVQITNPLVVQNALHAEEIQKLGKTVNGIAQGLHDERKKQGGGVDSQKIAAAVKAADLGSLLVQVFGRAGLELPDLNLIEKALSIFFQRYDDPKSKFVDQPITIFLAELCGLGGIYGDAESGINTYQKGNVAFKPPGLEFLRKTRVGTEHEFAE